MEILIGLITGLFWPALIIVGIVWFVKKLSNQPKTDYIVDEKAKITAPATWTSDGVLRKRIAEEIRAQSGQYKTPAQKKVVEEMAQTVEYFATHGYHEKVEIPNELPQATTIPAMAATIQPAAESQVEYETPWKKMQVLDGATILLYLGAFFLLASIGLYVGLGVGTTLKAVLVSLLVIAFYGAGLYLHQFTSRLKPVGATFAAIGMATLPMAGAAVYYFALNQTSGPPVWLVTSLLAVALYAHAVYVFRSTLVSYMIVFSTLSVVLASISSLGLAPNYFIQGIGFAGIAFALFARLFGKSSLLVSEAYEQSASFMVPFSVALSILFVVRVGWLQLALSLLLGAGYYAYLAIENTQYRSLYVLLGQLFGIGAILSTAFSIDGSGMSIALASAGLASLYMVLWLATFARKVESDPYRVQVKYLYLTLPVVACLAFLTTTGSLWWGVLSVLFVSASVYLYDRDFLSGSLTSTPVIILPLIISYFALDTPLENITIVAIYGAITFLTIVCRSLFAKRLGALDALFQQYIFVSCVSIATGFTYGLLDQPQFYISLCLGFSRLNL
jgi:hypothetical protein